MSNDVDRPVTRVRAYQCPTLDLSERELRLSGAFGLRIVRVDPIDGMYMLKTDRGFQLAVHGSRELLLVG